MSRGKGEGWREKGEGPTERTFVYKRGAVIDDSWVRASPCWGNPYKVVCS